MPLNDKNTCGRCGSVKIYSHGKTKAGTKRLRCAECGKTWAPDNSHSTSKADISEITEQYLKEMSLRELVKEYQGSPMRYNQKIREFLQGCPSWEDYLDATVENHYTRMVYLSEKSFSCYLNGNGGGNNKKTLALAVDAVSSVIIGYELANESNEKLWIRLLKRLKKRGFEVPGFLSMGIPDIENALKKVYPDAYLKINYHKTYRDRELNCCLNRTRLNSKLVSDASKFFHEYANDNLKKALKLSDGKDIQKAIFFRHEDFIRKIRSRIENRSMVTIDGLMLDFDVRFGKFHMLREDPQPLINAWIARKMLENTEIGISRLSYYTQVPLKTRFLDFACGNPVEAETLSSDSSKLNDLLIELCSRGIELPIVAYECELSLDKCSLL